MQLGDWDAAASHMFFGVSGHFYSLDQPLILVADPANEQNILNEQ
jgi:hypothetical protein